jgi:hypothetical protein
LGASDVGTSSLGRVDRASLDERRAHATLPNGWIYNDLRDERPRGRMVHLRVTLLVLVPLPVLVLEVEAALAEPDDPLAEAVVRQPRVGDA